MELRVANKTLDRMVFDVVEIGLGFLAIKSSHYDKKNKIVNRTKAKKYIVQHVPTIYAKHIKIKKSKAKIRNSNLNLEKSNKNMKELVYKRIDALEKEIHTIKSTNRVIIKDIKGKKRNLTRDIKKCYHEDLKLASLRFH